MSLPLVPLDSADERRHRTIIATVLNELVKQSPQHGTWTATIAGSVTAGTYEISDHQNRYSRIGRLVFLTLDVTLAGSITGGGAGDMLITGAPYGKADGTMPQGAITLSGVNRADASTPTLSWNASNGATSLVVRETNDNAANTFTPVTGLAASDRIFGSLWYETDDP